MRSLSNRYGFLLLFIISVLCFTCTKSKNTLTPIDKFIEINHLKTYDYLFLIHLNGSDCFKCLSALEKLPIFDKRIKGKKTNLFIGIIGDIKDKNFIDLCRFLDLNFPYIDESKCTELSSSLIMIKTQTCVFIDRRYAHMIYQDYIPEEKQTFEALLVLIKNYCGLSDID